MIFVFVAIALIMVIRTHILFRKRSAAKAAEEEDAINEFDAHDEIIKKCSKQAIKAIVSANQVLSLSLESFLHEDRSGLRNAQQACKEFSKKAKKNKDKVYSVVEKITESSIDTSHFYVQMVDYEREMAHAVHFMVEPMLNHLENNHKPFIPQQIEKLTQLATQIDTFFNYVLHEVKEEKFEEIENIISERAKLFELINAIEKHQIKRIKNKEVNTRNSQLFFKIISEIKNLLLHTVNLVKSERDFITFTRQKK